jgi:hypothetical protein
MKRCSSFIVVFVMFATTIGMRQGGGGRRNAKVGGNFCVG